MTILVVDEDTVVLQTLALVLEKAGHSVLRAETAWRALDLLRVFKVDCVVMEYGLLYDGKWLGRVIKRTRPAMPILVVSSDPSAIETLPFADALVAKPEPPEKLLALIAQLNERSAPRKMA